LADLSLLSAAQKGNPFLWSGTPFCGLKAVRPPGNSIGINPAAFAWRARVVSGYWYIQTNK